MHSFRLRYVALGLLIYIQSAFSDTCGSDGFVDVASSTVLSSAVFEGQPKKLAKLKDGRYLVWFKVTTIYKGNLTGGGVGNSDSLHVLVGNFGPSKDRDRCIASTAGLRFNSRTSYLVFLNRTGRPAQSVSVDEFEGTNFTNYYSKINNSSSSSVFYYSISGFPENATRQACQEARNYSSRNSGIAPRIELHAPKRHLKVGKKLQLTCRLKEGRPPPVLTWFRNGTALDPNKTNKHMVLRKKGKALNLIIRRTRAADAGVYQCRAANVLGSTRSQEANVLGSARSKNLTIELVSLPRKNRSSQHRNDSSEILVSPNPQNVSSQYTNDSLELLGGDLHLNESHEQLCDNQEYCNGKGLCIFLKKLPTKPICRCQKDWEGTRCEEKVTALSWMASDNKKKKFKRTLHSHS